MAMTNPYDSRIVWYDDAMYGKTSNPSPITPSATIAEEPPGNTLRIAIARVLTAG
jgi:hypothetical protein